MSHDSPEQSVMLQVLNVGPFVRCLLPVHLSDGYTVTFGVWLGVSPDDFQRAFRDWWAPEYRDLVLDGRLGNSLPGWGLLAAPATAVVRDPEQTPYVSSSSDELLQRVLNDEWDHEAVLSRVP